MLAELFPGPGAGAWSLAGEEAVAAMVAAGDLAGARSAVDAWLARPALPGAEAAAACLWGSLVRRAAGDWFAAAQWAAMALRLAEAAGHPAAVARAHLELGTIRAEFGDVGPARNHLQAFLDHAPAVQAPPAAVAQARAALAVAAELARDHAGAGAAWAAAAELLPAAQGRIQAHIRAAWAWLLAGQATAAAPHLQAVQDVAAALPPAALAAHLVNRALWLRLLGNGRGALALCRQVRELAGAGARARGQAAWLAAELTLALGDRAGAREWGELAREQAIQARWPALVDRVQRVLRQAEADGAAAP